MAPTGVCFTDTSLSVLAAQMIFGVFFSIELFRILSASLQAKNFISASWYRDQFGTDATFDYEKPLTLAMIILYLVGTVGEPTLVFLPIDAMAGLCLAFMLDMKEVLVYVLGMALVFGTTLWGLRKTRDSGNPIASGELEQWDAVTMVLAKFVA